MRGNQNENRNNEKLMAQAKQTRKMRKQATEQHEDNIKRTYGREETSGTHNQYSLNANLKEANNNNDSATSIKENEK
jgi:hypothetical protein